MVCGFLCKLGQMKKNKNTLNFNFDNFSYLIIRSEIVRRYFMMLCCAFALSACSEGAGTGGVSAVSSSSGSNNTTPSGEKIYRVLTEEMYEPYIMRRSGGQMGGFEYDILQAVAEHEKLTLQFISTDFEAMLQGIKNGEADIISSGVVVTPERATYIDFTEPFIETGTVMLVQSSNASIKTFADIKGHTVSTQSGSFYAKQIEGLGGMLIPESTAWMTVNNTVTGKAEATMGDRYVLQYHLNRDNNQKLRLVDNPEQEASRLAFGVRKGDAELVGKLNRGLAAIRANGTYDQIYARWFGKTVNPSS